jgi:hypothetical protein
MRKKQSEIIKVISWIIFSLVEQFFEDKKMQEQKEKNITIMKFRFHDHERRYPNGNFFGELTNFGDLTILTNHFNQPFLV